MMSLHTETQLRLRECGKRLGGDSLSPRQSLAQPSLALTKNVKMEDDLYSSDAWKKASPKQRQEFISKLRATQRIERDRKKAEKEAAPVLKKKSKAKRRAAAALRRKTNRPANKAKSFVSGVDVASTAFLETYEWRKLRMEALKKYGPKCQCCGATPATGAVMNVDHIKPRKLFPDLALDINNLQILCHECNHGKGNWDQTDWR